jgi:hypothetical protein
MLTMRDYFKQELEKLESEGRLRHVSGLRVFAEPHAGRREGFHHVRIWKGKQSRPYFDHLVKSDQVEATIRQHADRAERDEQAREERKADRKRRQIRIEGQFQPGIILHGSWGYEQTNCEFYEVISRPSPLTAVIRKVASRIERETGPMAAMMSPVPGEYVGEEVKKKIGPWGIAFEHFTLDPVEPGRSYYASWYA